MWAVRATQTHTHHCPCKTEANGHVAPDCTSHFQALKRPISSQDAQTSSVLISQSCSPPGSPWEHFSPAWRQNRSTAYLNHPPNNQPIEPRRPHQAAGSGAFFITPSSLIGIQTSPQHSSWSRVLPALPVWLECRMIGGFVRQSLF